jgi:hypothetical protein
MSFSHFDLVLGNYEPNVDQTLLELFLYIWIFNINGRQMTDDGRQVMAKAHVAFGKVS